MKKFTTLSLAILLAIGAGSALAQTGDPDSSAPGGPPNGPMAPATGPAMPGPTPRGSGNSMGGGTIYPPTTTAPENPPSMTPPSMANNPPAGAMPNTSRASAGEAQARARIEADGYRNVGPLTRGPDGRWQGTAMRGSTSVEVMVDGRGNVLTP